MKSVMAIASLFALNAFAAGGAQRQHISCEGNTKATKVYTIDANIDADVVLNEMWRKDKDGHDIIVTYTNGDRDGNGTTTARVTLTVPGSKKSDPFSGKFPFSDYYEVNKQEAAGGGYSKSDFDGKAYRSIHGHDKNQSMDMMFYYPDEIVGKSAKGFHGLVTYQPSVADQGYYNVPMNCDSTVK